MFSRRAVVSAAGLLLAALPAIAQDSPNPDDAKRDKNLQAGEAEAKRMLLLMDADQNGKVSKQEFMRFMETEFDRLDVNKDGELDVKELTRARVRIIRPR